MRSRDMLVLIELAKLRLACLKTVMEVGSNQDRIQPYQKAAEIYEWVVTPVREQQARRRVNRNAAPDDTGESPGD